VADWETGRHGGTNWGAIGWRRGEERQRRRDVKLGWSSPINVNIVESSTVCWTDRDAGWLTSRPPAQLTARWVQCRIDGRTDWTCIAINSNLVGWWGRLTWLLAMCIDATAIILIEPGARAIRTVGADCWLAARGWVDLLEWQVRVLPCTAHSLPSIPCYHNVHDCIVSMHWVINLIRLTLTVSDHGEDMYICVCIKGLTAV